MESDAAMLLLLEIKKKMQWHTPFTGQTSEDKWRRAFLTILTTAVVFHWMAAIK